MPAGSPGWRWRLAPATRISAIALNAYREQVRARVLYGLLAAALATAAYSLVVATLSLQQEARVVADIGTASMSLYAVLVAIVIGATTLHSELELKTIFPILTRELHRHEYLLGKYLGTLATLAVFVAIDGAAVLAVLALETHASPALVFGIALGMLVLLALGWLRAKYTRVFVALPWSLALFLAMALVAKPAGAERQLVVASCALVMCEVAIVTAVATFFSSFSSPFLTAIFTLGVFLVGRSADTLGNLPVRAFGQAIHDVGRALARVFPNLQVYVPARPLLLGEIADVPVWRFVGSAAAMAALYAAAMLVLSALIFRKRDFQ
jgi:ABC-type transport system involved in multi-copper enzyme maturation permease subunit